MRKGMSRSLLLATLLIAPGLLAAHGRATAHCDTMDGPIVPEAQHALATGELKPVLKWVPKSDEEIIREAFQRARSLKGKGHEVEALAEQWFLETLIRVHRQGEGAGFTGLKPAGSMAPAYEAADKALETGNVDGLATQVATAVKGQIEMRFRKVSELRAHADESLQAGRLYVDAYVEYMHFIEGLHEFMESDHGGGNEEAGADHGAGIDGHR